MRVDIRTAKSRSSQWVTVEGTCWTGVAIWEIGAARSKAWAWRSSSLLDCSSISGCRAGASSSLSGSLTSWSSTVMVTCGCGGVFSGIDGAGSGDWTRPGVCIGGCGGVTRAVISCVGWGVKNPK